MIVAACHHCQETRANACFSEIVYAAYAGAQALVGSFLHFNDCLIVVKWNKEHCYAM